jgi:hypothetical protein
MNILEASEVIKDLYRHGSSDEYEWNHAIENFAATLASTNDSDELEKCILSDESWELSVDARLALLEKAKSTGASSMSFLKDYFGYLAAHLDPSEEKSSADRELQKLLASGLSD